MPSTNGHGPTNRVILYARVSTDEQARSGYSLAQQLEALGEYAAREGYEVLEEVVDPGQSGASLERPGMDRVRDLVAEGDISVVLAQDRFAREPAYHYLLRREFEEHGTKIRALNDHGGESPEGELTDGILDRLAKYERAKIAERSRRGKLRKAREGKVIAAQRPNYGFEYNAARDGYEVDEETMRVVRCIFYMVGAEGRTIHAVKRTQVSESGPDGRCYRQRTKISLKPSAEWIAVPVRDSGTPRQWVHAAREAVRDNKSCSSAEHRFRELSGSIFYCGRRMSTTTINPARGHHYYRCTARMRYGEDACSLSALRPSNRTG